MVVLVLTGEQLKAARSRARMTQEAAAEAAGVTLRTWGNWERSTSLTTAAEARARDAVGPHLYAAEASPLTSVSDAQLLAEIAARFDRGRQQDHGTANTRAPGSGATRESEPAPVMGADEERWYSELSPAARVDVDAARATLDPAAPPPKPRRAKRSRGA